jgi:hypothetical protein
MELTNTLRIVLLIAIALGGVLILWYLMRRVRAKRNFPDPPSLKQVSDARIEAGEAAATLVSEQIEEMVKDKLSEFSDLQGKQLDFGTASDGSLEITFSGKVYSSIESISDARVREAIAAAVKKFNI